MRASTQNLLLLTAATLMLAACGSEERRERAHSAETTKPAPEAARLIADSVYRNGRIYTVNETQPWAEAVAIKGGKFLAVGSGDDVAALIGDGTEVVDLGGAFAMPGIGDTHIHPALVIDLVPR